MKTIRQKIILFLMSFVMICSVLPVRAAGFEILRTFQAQADTGAAYTVKTMDYGYSRNTYLSLRDIAMILKDTDKAFSLEITKNAVSLNPGNAYTPVGGENVPWADNQNPNISLLRNEFKVNGQTVFYYTLIMRMPSGCYDCFIMASDMAMILDVNIKLPAAGFLQIDTQEPFRISTADLERAGYFYGVNSVLVGDATTGEIYYQYDAATAYPIASISKLMTYILTMEAVSSGQFTLENSVTISGAVQLLADSSDGIIPLKAGEQIKVQDLLYGALLPSSNECALCLAEAVAGSEEVFVRMMNQKAVDLGLSQAAFYNSNGLPVYTEDPVISCVQNRMSAKDLFRMVSYLLRVYPQVTDITSTKETTLTSINVKVNNTNPLLYNLPGTTGLKTGTTNKAGACLVTSLTADDGYMEHDLVVIVLGTENSRERGRVSELLARYALQAFYEGAEEMGDASGQASGKLPTHAEAAVDCILRTAREQKQDMSDQTAGAE